MSRDDATPSNPRRDRPRTRSEIASERAALAAATDREIDAIAAESHARLPRDQARGLAAAYARYSTRFQDSIGDQVRGLYEAAEKQRLFLPRESVFYDLAASGRKSRRPGLIRLRTRLAAGGVDVFLVFATNRLFRKTYEAIKFVQEEVVERNIRALFVKSGIDTADDRRWQLLLDIYAFTDNLTGGMYADNIRAAHEGLFDGALVHGSITFGYRGVEVPGRPTKRGLPRHALQVDPEASAWVRRAFELFADEGLAMDEIARTFNTPPVAPPSSKSLNGRWDHKSIRHLLANPRYRGLWEYGRNANVWQSSKDYTRQVRRAEPLRAAQFEHLRIVPDDLWHRAQARLAEQPRPTRREPRDGDRRSRPLLLNGLFRCPTHDRPLYVGGAGSHVLFCKACTSIRAEDRPLYSQLNRALALRATCRALAGLVRGDDGLVREIVAACREQAARARDPDPARLEGLGREGRKLDDNIRFLMENPGETERDRRESADRLRTLRRRRAEVAATLAAAKAGAGRPAAVPDEAEARALIEGLAGLLESAAAGAPEDARAARQAVALLTGGRIDLEQAGERRKHGGWLRGRIRARLVSTLSARAAGVPVDADDEGVEVVIEYREPSDAEALAGEVMALCDRGLLIKDVAKDLGISVNLARRARAVWYARRGEAVPDGRSRRKDCPKKTVEPPKYARVADEAKRLLDRGMLMKEIGIELGCDSTTLTKAVAHWHESRGLAVPDGRTRRKALERKCSQPRPAESDSGLAGPPTLP